MPENTASILDDPDVIAALGEGDELTEDQVQLLEILLDPQNDPAEAIESRAEALEEFDSFTGMDIDEIDQVADRLRQHLNREADRYDAFDFELIRGRDGTVEQYNVSTRLGTITWLSVSEETKHLLGYRVDLAGLRAAVYTAEALAGDHALLLKQITTLRTTADEKLDAIRRLCEDQEYKVSGKHETWDAYHEGRSALADEIEQLIDGTSQAAHRDPQEGTLG